MAFRNGGQRAVGPVASPRSSPTESSRCSWRSPRAARRHRREPRCRSDQVLELTALHAVSHLPGDRQPAASARFSRLATAPTARGGRGLPRRGRLSQRSPDSSSAINAAWSSLCRGPRCRWRARRGERRHRRPRPRPSYSTRVEPQIRTRWRALRQRGDGERARPQRSCAEPCRAVAHGLP